MFKLTQVVPATKAKIIGNFILDVGNELCTSSVHSCIEHFKYLNWTRDKGKCEVQPSLQVQYAIKSILTNLLKIPASMIDRKNLCCVCKQVI